jgi:hypothetical protein
MVMPANIFLRLATLRGGVEDISGRVAARKSGSSSVSGARGAPASVVRTMEPSTISGGVALCGESSKPGEALKPGEAPNPGRRDTNELEDARKSSTLHAPALGEAVESGASVILLALATPLPRSSCPWMMARKDRPLWEKMAGPESPAACARPGSCACSPVARPSAPDCDPEGQ